MSKRLKFLIALIAVAGISWYLFKDYNYKVRFKVNQQSSVIYNHLLKWNNLTKAEDSLVKTISKEPFKTVEQHYYIEDTLLNIKWSLNKINNGSTQVVAKIKDEQNPILQNLNVILPNSNFSKTSKSLVNTFAKSVISYSETFKISSVTTDSIPSRFCAFIPLESSVDMKARVMSQYINIVMSYLKSNEIELSSNPFLEVRQWNRINDSIQFNFCFPIKHRDSFPPTKLVQFKQTESKKALKTVFNGNYRDTNLAWLSILDYAEEKNISVSNKPVEFFLNDPHSGTKPLEWEAEIYLPIQD